MQLNGAAARAERCKMRYRMLRDNRDRVEELFAEGLAENDPQKVDLAIKAGNFLGVDFRASADFVQKSEVKEDVKQESRVITFTEVSSAGGTAAGAEKAAG